MNREVDLSAFYGGDFDKGAGKIKITLWYFVNAFFVRASWNPFMGLKIFLLRLFGANIGKGLIIKNNVIIKFPWKLVVGDNCWLGENCWIDNLDNVTIGNNVCISQGAMLLTGNHDYRKFNMPYRNAPIIIENGAWIPIGANYLADAIKAFLQYDECQLEEMGHNGRILVEEKYSSESVANMFIEMYVQLN